MFRIDTMILQYNLSEKYSKIINQVEINARSVYLTIKEQKNNSTKEMLELQELLKEVNTPLVELVKQYNEKISQINASKVLIEKITLEEVTNEYIDFFLLDDKG